MICRLTIIGFQISFFAAVAFGQTTTANRPAGGARPATAAIHSVDWQRLPLRDAIGRLNSVADVPLFLDRRVDSSQRIDLQLRDVRVEEIVARLATENSLGYVRLGRLVYLGPLTPARRIVGLAAERRRDIATMPVEERQSLLERRRIVWPQLTEPRGLITRLAQDHGWRVSGSKRIPHDLWAAGELPAMTLADQLTLLLAGFDLTFRVLPEGRAMEIVPVEWESIGPTPPAAPTERRAAGPTPGGRQVFTLRVENQPVGNVLEQLGRRLGWQLTVDDEALSAAGRSLDKRVSFRVENADEDQLLEAMLAPAGLRAQRDGKTVRIAPR